jgi:hypothetical protein
MSEKFAFLTSTRFWALIIGAVAIYMSQEGIISEALSQLITTVSAVFIGIKSVDRFSEQMGSKTTIVEEPCEENKETSNL